MKIDLHAQMIFLILISWLYSGVESEIISCEEPFSCTNSDIKYPSSHSSSVSVYGLGYKSIFNHSGGITLSCSSCTIQCDGAYSCSNVESIITGVEAINFNGENSGSHIKSLVHSDTDIYCYGTNSCRYSNMSSNDIYCSGDHSCAYSIVRDSTRIFAGGPYSMRNSEVYSSGGGYMFVWFYGYNSGYKGKFVCDDGDSCDFRCYGHGCYGATIECIGSADCEIKYCEDGICYDRECDFESTQIACPIYLNDNSTYYEIKNISYNIDIFNVSDMIETYYCNWIANENAMIFDIYLENVDLGNNNLYNANGSICCRGTESCVDLDSVMTTPENNIVCSGAQACHGITTMSTNYYDFSNDSYTGNIYCTASHACSYSTFINVNAVYCGGDYPCQHATFINVSSVYCSGGEYSCEYGTFYAVSNIYVENEYWFNIDDTFIYSSYDYSYYDHDDSNRSRREKREMNIYMYAYDHSAGYGSTMKIYCNATDTCNIFCYTNGACSSSYMTVYCFGKCNIYCNETIGIGCPRVEILSSKPTVSPTQVPTLPTSEPTIPTAAPTMLPTIPPTNQPTHYTLSWMNRSNDTNSITIHVCIRFMIDAIDIPADVLKAIKTASVELRNADISYENQIFGEIILNQTSKYIPIDDHFFVNMTLRLFFQTEIMLDGWVVDIDLIETQFETDLQRIRNDSGLQVSCMNLIEATPKDSDDEGNNKSVEEISNSQRLDLLYDWILLGLVGFLGLILAGGIMHAKQTKNRLFRWMKILLVCTYMLDFFSDIVFVLQVWFSIEEFEENKDKTEETSLLFDSAVLVFSISFLMAPAIVNIFQLQNEMKNWLSDVITKQVIRRWVAKYVKVLYLVSILTGSAFSAIELCNSNLFGLEIFSMDLPRRDVQYFKYKRIYSIVLMENIPQLIMQGIWSFYYQNVTAITLISMIFSVLSVLLSLFEYSTKQRVLESDQLYVISFTVGSKEIKSMSDKVFMKQINQRRYQVCFEFAKLLSVNYFGNVNLLKPIRCKEGVNLILHFGDDTMHEKHLSRVLTQSLLNGKLAKVILLFYLFVFFLFSVCLLALLIFVLYNFFCKCTGDPDRIQNQKFANYFRS